MVVWFLLTLGSIIFIHGESMMQHVPQSPANTLHVCFQNTLTFSDICYVELNYPPLGGVRKRCSCWAVPQMDFNGTLRVSLTETVRRTGASSCRSRLQIYTSAKVYRLLCPYVSSYFDIPFLSYKRLDFQQDGGTMKIRFKVIEGEGSVSLSCMGDPLPERTILPSASITSNNITYSTAFKSGKLVVTTPKTTDRKVSTSTAVSRTTSKSVLTLSTIKDPAASRNNTKATTISTSTSYSSKTLPSNLKTTHGLTTSVTSTTTRELARKTRKYALEQTTATWQPQVNATTAIHKSIPKENLEALYEAVFRFCICHKLRMQYPNREDQQDSVVSREAYRKEGSILLAKLWFSRTN